MQAAANAIKSGQSVVIDNTNPSAKARQDFIGIAKKKGKNNYRIKSINCNYLKLI